MNKTVLKAESLNLLFVPRQKRKFLPAEQKHGKKKVLQKSSWKLSSKYKCFIGEWLFQTMEAFECQMQLIEW